MNNQLIISNSVNSDEISYPSVMRGVSIVVCNNIDTEKLKETMRFSRVSNELICSTKKRLTIENGFMEVPVVGSSIERFRVMYKYANGKYIWLLPALPSRDMLCSMRAFINKPNNDQEIGYFNCLFKRDPIVEAQVNLDIMSNPIYRHVITFLKKELKIEEFGNSVMGISDLLKTAFFGKVGGNNAVIIPRKLINFEELSRFASLNEYIAYISKKYPNKRLSGLCYLPGKTTLEVLKDSYKALIAIGNELSSVAADPIQLNHLKKNDTQREKIKKLEIEDK